MLSEGITWYIEFKYSKKKKVDSDVPIYLVNLDS